MMTHNGNDGVNPVKIKLRIFTSNLVIQVNFSLHTNAKSVLKKREVVIMSNGRFIKSRAKHQLLFVRDYLQVGPCLGSILLLKHVRSPQPLVEDHK